MACRLQCEDVTADVHLAMELEGLSQVEEVSHVNEKKCTEIMKKTIDFLEPKDMYLEKKLREIALAWHAEKQVGSILRCIENLTPFLACQDFKRSFLCLIHKHPLNASHEEQY